MKVLIRFCLYLPLCAFSVDIAPGLTCNSSSACSHKDGVLSSNGDLSGLLQVNVSPLIIDFGRRKTNHDAPFRGPLSIDGHCMPTYASSSMSVLEQKSVEKIQAYYINMESSVRRRLLMEQEFLRSSFSAERFPAVDMMRVASGEFDAKYVIPQGLNQRLLGRLSSEEQNKTVACYISHMELLMQAQRELAEDDIVLIMEDDVLFPESFSALTLRTIALAPPDWVVLKLSNWGHFRDEDLASSGDIGGGEISFYKLLHPWEVPRVPGLKQKPGLIRNQKYKYNLAGTSGYVVKVSSIPRLLSHMQRQPINDADAMMFSDGEFPSFAIRPQILCLRDDSINSTIRVSAR